MCPTRRSKRLSPRCMRLSASLRAFFVTARISMRVAVESRITIMFMLVATVATMISLFGVYSVALGKVGDVNGVTIGAALWSLSVYSIFWSTGVRYTYRDISDAIKNGSIELLLARPMHYLWYLAAWRSGRPVVGFVCQILMNGLLLLLFIGLPPVAFSIWWLGAFVWLFVCGVLLSFLLFAMVGLTAFWIEDAQPVMWMVDKSVLVLGGAFVPVAMMPGALRRVAEWSPFGATLSSAQAFGPDFFARLPSLMFSQGVWLVVIGGACAVMWHRARVRVEVNGG